MNPEYLNTYFKIPHHRAEDLPSDFIIVTAFNPDGQNNSPESNQSLDADLAALIKKKCLSCWRVIGGSRDFIHAELGYAVATNLEAGIEMGIHFHQEAIFWINNGNLFLVDCSTGQQTFMGGWKSRIIG